MIRASNIPRFFLYLVPLTVVIVYQGSIFPFIVGKYVFLRTVVGFALIFSAWAWARGEIRSASFTETFRNPIVLAVAAFTFFFVLSGFTGVDPHASFWSNYERGEGGLQLIAFFSFFALMMLFFKEWASWRRLLMVSLTAAVGVVGYGVFAAMKYVGAVVDVNGTIVRPGPFTRIFENFVGGSWCDRFAGSLGNAEYAATYLMFALFFAAYFLCREKKSFFRWGAWALIAISAASLVLTQTRGTFLGLGVGILAALAYLFFSFKERRYRMIAAALFVAVLAAGVLGIAYRRSINLAPWCKGGNRILDVSVGAETLQTRLVLWHQSLEAFAERPLLGWGPENFSVAFEKYFDTRHAAWFDRAHNIFFDYLVSSGLLGLLAFLSIFGAYYIQYAQWVRKERHAEKEMHEKKRNGDRRAHPARREIVRALFFAMPIAYLVQGIVLFDVLPVYMSLFIALGLAGFVFSGADDALPAYIARR